MKNTLYFIFITLIYIGCSSKEFKVSNVVVKVPQNNNGNWFIKVEHENFSLSIKPVITFKVYSDNKIVDFYYNIGDLKPQGSEIDAESCFSDKYTPYEETVWFSNLDYKKIDSIEINAKNNYEDFKIIYCSIIKGNDLK